MNPLTHVSSAEDALQQGMIHHQAGRFAEAEAIYRQVLVQNPDHPQAIHLLGVIALQVGKADVALALIRRAIALAPNEANFHSNLGEALNALREPHQAAAAYQRALALDSQRVEAYNGLGNALQRLGQTDQAIAAYQTAVRIRSEYAEAHLNLGIVLSVQKQWSAAVESFHRALTVAPDLFLAHYHLGNALRSLNRLDEALDSFRQAVTLNPNSATAYCDYGIALRAKGELAQAMGVLGRSIALKPDLAEAHSGLGSALRQVGRLEEAEKSFRQAIALKPDFAEAHNNLGSTYQDKEQIADAIAEFRIATRLAPGDAVMQYNLGSALFADDRFDDAIACFHRVLAIDPNMADAHNNLGNALRGLGQYDQAEAALRTAIQLRHDMAHGNLGTVLQEKGRVVEAIAEFRRAVELLPGSAPFHYNLAFALLLIGQFEEGWREYEWRLQLKKRVERPQPFWDGSSLQGKRILLESEQGFGDSLQFSRFISVLKHRHGPLEIVFECQNDLLELFKSFEGIGLMPRSESSPECDVRCALVSLPKIFGVDLASIPRLGTVPYLRADSAKVKYWCDRLDNEKRLKVGLVWAGRPEHKNDRNRSIPLKHFLPMLQDDASKASFFSLQKGAPAAQLQEFPGLVADWTSDLHDFSDTAALIENLDLVISVDTAVAHLAGALGKPVWTLLPFAPDWRWLLDREDSPWYPMMRLFRQPAIGDWPSVIDRVVHELARL